MVDEAWNRVRMKGEEKKRKTSVDKEEKEKRGHIGKLQQMFGGGTQPSKRQVRIGSPKIKNCVRSKLDRCLVHRCPYVKTQKKKRIMAKDEEGRVRCMDKLIDEWLCETRIRVGSSIDSSGFVLGGKGGASKDVRSADNHVGAPLPRKRVEIDDNVGLKHGQAVD